MFTENFVYVILIVGFVAFAYWSAPVPRQRHDWEYRSPFTRTCNLCRRQEDWHCWAEDAHKPKAGPGYVRDNGWWEEMRPGDGPCGDDGSAR